jgi:carbonic anhydrase
LQSIEAVKQNQTVAKAIKERGLTVHGVIYDVPAGQLRLLKDEKEGRVPIPRG